MQSLLHISSKPSTAKWQMNLCKRRDTASSVLLSQCDTEKQSSSVHLHLLLVQNHCQWSIFLCSSVWPPTPAEITGVAFPAYSESYAMRSETGKQHAGIKMLDEKPGDLLARAERLLPPRRLELQKQAFCHPWRHHALVDPDRMNAPCARFSSWILVDKGILHG